MNKRTTSIAVFASGSGTNFEALLQHPQHGSRYEIVLFVTDRPHCLAKEKAAAANLSVFSFLPKEFASKAEFEQLIVQECRRKGVQLIVLAGYMRLIGPGLLEAYPNRIINLHPSLLPAFPGKDAIEQAFIAKVPVTGVSVHFVDSGMDTGPVIQQQDVAIQDNDTLESLRGRLQAAEHVLLPAVVCELAEKLEKENGDGKKSIN
ncbi:MAG: phosphoribosylglycinamide formyltransferase [Bacilli bacterium]|nr:phosphoribosylglycinamide formyltransferase [Bacilli bacterium]